MPLHDRRAPGEASCYLAPQLYSTKHRRFVNASPSIEKPSVNKGDRQRNDAVLRDRKLVAFIVSAFFSGLAGSLMVFYLGTVSVGTFVDISVGVQVIIAAVIGGRRTVIGAAIGAIFLIGMGEILRPLGSLATLIVSVMALLVILFFPEGFLGMLRGRDRS